MLEGGVSVMIPAQLLRVRAGAKALAAAPRWYVSSSVRRPIAFLLTAARPDPNTTCSLFVRSVTDLFHSRGDYRVSTKLIHNIGFLLIQPTHHVRFGIQSTKIWTLFSRGD